MVTSFWRDKNFQEFRLLTYAFYVIYREFLVDQRIECHSD